MQSDSKKTLLAHKKLIQKKLFLKKLYTDFYCVLKNQTRTYKKVVEIGSGGGFIKKIIPNIITSDIIDGKDIDQVFSVEKMPFKDQTIDAFVMFDVFHHIKNPEKAVREMQRCLKRGGEIVMIEPWNTPWSRFIYTYIHPEPFDAKGGWHIKGGGRLTGANGALPWIVFERDRKLFEKYFSRLKIVSIIPHTPLRYLISGGLSPFQFLPSFLYSTVVAVENIFSPLHFLTAMFVTITIKKVS